MKFKISHYSDERLKREILESQNRLFAYLRASSELPSNSFLCSLSIKYAIKYEETLLKELRNEIRSRYTIK